MCFTLPLIAVSHYNVTCGVSSGVVDFWTYCKQCDLVLDISLVTQTVLKV